MIVVSYNFLSYTFSLSGTCILDMPFLHRISQDFSFIFTLKSLSFNFGFNHDFGFPRGSIAKNLPANAGDMVRFLGREDPPRREWQPTLVFFPGKSMDRGAWRATAHGVAGESDTTERLNSSSIIMHVLEFCSLPFCYLPVMFGQVFLLSPCSFELNKLIWFLSSLV